MAGGLFAAAGAGSGLPHALPHTSEPPPIAAEFMEARGFDAGAAAGAGGGFGWLRLNTDSEDWTGAAGFGADGAAAGGAGLDQSKRSPKAADEDCAGCGDVAGDPNIPKLSFVDGLGCCCGAAG